jgi:hypothetical protein
LSYLNRRFRATPGSDRTSTLRTRSHFTRQVNLPGCFHQFIAKGKHTLAGFSLNVKLPIVPNKIAPRFCSCAQVWLSLGDRHQPIPLVALNRIVPQYWARLCLRHHPIFVLGNPVANNEWHRILIDVNCKPIFFKDVLSQFWA